MKELTKEQKISMIERNIESQASKLYGLKLQLIMQEASGVSQAHIDRTNAQIEAQTKAQLALEDELQIVKAQ